MFYNTATPVIPTVNGMQLPMELDTASSISLISEETWKEHFQAKPLEAAIVVLKTYTGQKRESIGTNDS